MVTKKENNKSWWNQVNFVEELEQFALQSIKNQKEWINATKEQLVQLEDHSKKMTTDWKNNVQTVFEKANIELDGQQNWFNKIEEIGHKSQMMAILPSRTSLEILDRSNEHYEEMFMNTMAEAKKVREEGLKVFDAAAEQMKEMQNGMFNLFGMKPLVSK